MKLFSTLPRVTIIIIIVCAAHKPKYFILLLFDSQKKKNRSSFFSLLLSIVGKTKIYCAKCQKKCSGEVLRVTDKYFHKTCFQCVTCNKSLAAGGFFAKDNTYYCVVDYQKLYGTKCAVCQQYVEGEVVSTMGNTYHQKCFTCTKCNQPFESGSKVIIRNNMYFNVNCTCSP